MNYIKLNGVEAFISTFTFNKYGSVDYKEIQLICDNLKDEYIDMLIDELETYIHHTQKALDNNEFKQGDYYFHTDPYYVTYEESDEELEALSNISRANELLSALYAYERPND